MLQEVSNGRVETERKQKSYTFEFKKKVIERALEDGIAPAAREFAIKAPSTVHTWMKRYKENGWDGLKGKSRRPHHQPKKTSQWIIDKILKIKKEKPEMGSHAMSGHLGRFEAINLSSKTIGKLFKKHDLPDGDAGHAEASYRTKGDDKKQLEQQVEKELGEWERFSRPYPNDLWQMDIKSFYIRDAHKVYLISALDDCSRMIVGWGLFRDQTADNVLEVLRTALLPARVRFHLPGRGYPGQTYCHYLSALSHNSPVVLVQPRESRKTHQDWSPQYRENAVSPARACFHL